MAKRAQCPKCQRDTWSEKWLQCSSGDCLYAGSKTFGEVAVKKARADAAGRQQKRNKTMVRQAIDDARTIRDGLLWEQHAQNMGDLSLERRMETPEDNAAYRRKTGQAVGVVTSGSMRLRPLPGEKCPTCNRKVPKRRKADATDSL